MTKKPSQAEKKQKTPQQNLTNQSSNPAPQPYQPPSANDSGRLVDRTANLGDKWGNLPDKLRDELSQAEDDFRSIRGEYKKKLLEYSKVISSQE